MEQTSAIDLVRCPGCGKALGSRAQKGKFVVQVGRGKGSKLTLEIVIGSVTCSRCGYCLRVPISTLEVAAPKPKPAEAQDAR